ncbi:MAG: hypothetical protein QOH41_2118 [Blastocatellia bacterium]|jgi:hypothetical protein|nr:hypothetical protein [Blastocatellia bacterium]
MPWYWFILIPLILAATFVGAPSMLISLANTPAVLIGANREFRGTVRYKLATIVAFLFQSTFAITLSALIISYTRYMTSGKLGYIFAWMVGLIAAIYPMWQTRSRAKIERISEPEAYVTKEATHAAIPYSLASTVTFALLFVLRPVILDALYYWLLVLSGFVCLCSIISIVIIARRHNSKTMPEDVPLFAILEQSLTMILGDEFENVVFDRQHILTEEEADYVRGFAKPFAIAMLFNELLKRLKETQKEITAARLKGYFTETARNVYWLLAGPDANEEAEQLISIALGFLDINVVCDIDDGEPDPDDESSITKFVNAIFSESSDDAVHQNKVNVVTRYAEVIEDRMKKLTGDIFAQSNVTL